MSERPGAAARFRRARAGLAQGRPLPHCCAALFSLITAALLLPLPTCPPALTRSLTSLPPTPVLLAPRSALAATLALSSLLYAADVPADQIALVMAAAAAANYLVFDGTKQGMALALLCAVVCPASEVRPAWCGRRG